MNGASAAQSESVIQTGIAAFSAFFDSVFVSVLPPMFLPLPRAPSDPCSKRGEC
jgi:hypothetical protein